MAPKKAKTVKRDQKHGGKNGKKEGLSGSSFFTWFMVIALLGVWTSVAVVWFDLVDYEEFLGKLGDYDADGDGDFDVDDAKVLLGLKERFVSKKISEDLDETDSIQSVESDISDADLEDALNAIKDSIPPYIDDFDLEDSLDDHETHDDAVNEFSLEDAVEPSVHESDDFDLEDALDDHETHDDAVNEFSLEDAVEPSVHESLRSESEVKEPEEEPVIEEEVHVQEEPAVEEQAFAEVTEQEPAASDEEDDVEEAIFAQEDEQEPAEDPEPVYEQEFESLVEEIETEFLNAPNTETEDSLDVDVEYAAEPPAVEVEEEIPPAPVADEEPEEELTEEPEPQDENFENDQETEEAENEEEYETHEEVFINEPAEDEAESYDEENEYNPQTELEEEEPAEISDVPEQDEESAPETSEDIIIDDHEEEVNENPVVVDRPSGKAEEQDTESSEGQQGEHTGGESLWQEKDKAKKKKPKLLNKFDKTIKVELDAAEKLRKKGKVEEALKAFELLVTKYPQSPRARYGKAQSEDDLAEKQRSNEILLRAIGSYEEVAGLPNVPTDLVKITLSRRANRQQFLGRMRGSILTLQKLVQLYPEDIALRNELGVGYLLLGDNQKAKQVYEEVLSLDPNSGFAKVHYGFILKAENKIIESIPYLKEGLLSGEPGTDDGRFYFHLGDAMQRAGDKEAYTWYEAGHKKGHFASVWQRSLYNVDGLKAQAWWIAKESGYTDLVRALESNWKMIRDEGLAVMDETKGLFVPEDENLREKGDWSQYTLWQQGRKNEKSCNAAPKTCALLERFPESTGCRRGQIKYSIMHPGTHVWPHTGPTNCRLRMHLGLVIPSQGCKIRCANETRSWKEGKVLIFDDSFEHEVWQEAVSYRLIFIVDVWHPELTQHQRRTLPAI